MPRLLAVTLVALLACVVPTRAADDPAALTFARDVQPLLKTYCGACHFDKAHKGDVSLAPFTSEDAVQSNPKLWRDVLTQLGDHTMPPESKPQPSLIERERLMNYVTHRLANLDLSKLPKDPGRVTIRRLNRQEYNNTVRDLLGVHSNPADAFPADGGGGGGFDNNADTLFVPPVLLEQYLQAAAECLANADNRLIFPVAPNDKRPKRVAARENLERFMTRAFRRPVDAKEVDRLMPLFDRADATLAKDPKAVRPFESALKLAYKAVLVSPHFLFRVEKDQPTKGAYAVSDFELASRLSYFLWASMPDDELFNLAKAGKLRGDATIDAQVRRMLKDPKSKALAEHFGGQWLGFNALLTTTAAPDRTKYPRYTAQLRDSFYYQAVEFVDSVFRDDRPITTLIESDYTYINEPIARLYEIPKIGGEELRRINLTDLTTVDLRPKGQDEGSRPILKPNERKIPKTAAPAAMHGGVLGLSAIHVVTSYPLRTSPVLRGRWVLDTLLGAPPPPPPPDVPKLPDDDAPSGADKLSLRQRLEKHRADPNCASCHARMDPLGFGLENFDPIGRWRTAIAGQPVDAVGKLTTGEQFTGPQELKQILLKKKDAFARNLAQKLLAYALGRGLEAYDEPAVATITSEFAKGEYKSATLAAAVAKSYPFRFRRGSGPQTAGR